MSFSGGLIRLVGIRALNPKCPIVVRNQPPLKTYVRANSTAIHDASSLARIDALAENLKSAVHLPAIHNHYPALVAELKEARKTASASIPPPLNERQIMVILEKLATSGRPADLQRIEEILTNMSTLFGVDPTMDVHTVVIRALIKQGNVRTVHRWLINMPLRAGHFSPTLEHFHLFLVACEKIASFKFMRNLVLSMRQSGCKPSTETFKILIRARWKMAVDEEKLPHIIVFKTLIEDMKREGLRHDATVSSLLYNGYAERGFIAYAEQLQAFYMSQFPDAETSQQQKQAAWNLQLSDVAHKRGIKAAIALFRTLQSAGCDTSASTVKAILRHSRSIADLRLIQSELGVIPTAVHWSILISNNVRTGHTTDAFLIYEETKKANIQPDAALVGPLLKALCRSTIKPPTEDSIDKALIIYNDLVQVAPPSPSTEVLKTSLTQHSVGPDADIYQTLLRGLATSTNLEKHFPIAKSLMDDMESRGIKANDSLTASSIIVLLMRRCSNMSEALQVYQRLGSALDEKGYAVVLNAFCKLSFNDSIQIPSLTSYFEIVRGMRRAGLTLTVEVYTILLHQLGIVATSLNDPKAEIQSDLRDRLITTTRRTHDLLTLDAAVSPDAHVWNQLMDTYQRLGCFGDSYRVWDMMYLSGRFDHISVSIILDACGYAGAWQIARQICAKLFKDRFQFNIHNWNTWLECLCRLGRLNDAVKVACLEMGKDGGSVAPNVESARILIKFARKYNQQAEVMCRIQRYLPKLWSTLPEDLRQP